MKNFKVTLLAFAAFLALSCEDAIDITQPGELSPENTFETVADLQFGIDGVYSAVGGETAILFTSLFTDEAAIGISNGGQGRSDGTFAFLLNSNNGSAASIWTNNYYLINLATRLIIYSDNVTVEPGSQDEADKKNIIAQAHALRAYGHFTLLSFFSEDITEDSSMGVIALNYIPGINDTPARNSTGEVFELIDADLDVAEAGVAEQMNNAYVSQDFIKALRARIAVYRERHTEALPYLNDLIAAYPLSTPSNYASMFQDSNTAPGTELIFKLRRDAPRTTGNFYQAWASVNTTASGSPFFEVGRALYNLLLPGDIRRSVVVHTSAQPYTAGDYAELPYGDYIQQDVLPVGKYPGSEGVQLLNDVKIFRASEMRLLRAEVFASQNNFAGVQSEIKAIRDARFTTGPQVVAVPATSQAAWALILDERRVELAFEGHRYIDLRRLGVLANRQVDRDPQDCSFNGFCTLPTTDYRFVLPIPFEELAANPSVQQNPGYNNNN
ncbi:MAG: RagB/SusD family nutrient uptake outer membrane protein [Flavobacterium sp.]